VTHEWDLLWRIGLALVLSSTIGVEREMRQKSAGLRTYTLVGVGAALTPCAASPPPPASG
jgi:putative Mg2+ transporter-C (MgtC) family protein